jgi:hypothetical protein
MDYVCITIEFNFTMAIGADATTTLTWVAGLTSSWQDSPLVRASHINLEIKRLTLAMSIMEQ